MNGSSDFMNYLYEEKINRLRGQRTEESIFHNSQRGIASPFARVRGAISSWVNGQKDNDLSRN